MTRSIVLLVQATTIDSLFADRPRVADLSAESEHLWHGDASNCRVGPDEFGRPCIRRRCVSRRRRRKLCNPVMRPYG